MLRSRNFASSDLQRFHCIVICTNLVPPCWAKLAFTMTVPEERLKDVEEARRKLLVHAPAVPSPLRRRFSSRTLLASRLARTSLGDAPSHSDMHMDDGADKESYTSIGRRAASEDDQATLSDHDAPQNALLKTYHQTVGLVLSQRSSAVFA